MQIVRLKSGEEFVKNKKVQEIINRIKNVLNNFIWLIVKTNDNIFLQSFYLLTKLIYFNF